MNPTRRIFAIGDNGFRADPKTHSLYQTILASTGIERPKVCLIPTASGDDQIYMNDFMAMFRNYPCELTQVSLFRGDVEDIKTRILSQDLIYVTGGNTRNLMVLWKERGVDVLLKEAYQKGIVMAGGSAGSLCWFESGVTDSIPERFSSMKCLGILKGSNCPHYNELTRKPFYLQAVQSGELSAGYAAENGVALYFENESF